MTSGTQEIWPVECECLPCSEDSVLHTDMCAMEDVTVDLIDPLYEDGVLSTEKGGILCGSDLRIQARKIIYTRQLSTSTIKVHCEGDILIVYHGRLLVGDSFDYDFLTNEGVLTNGRISIPPWQIGGKEIYLAEKGNITIVEGYIKTSESLDEDWELLAPKITIFKNHILSAHGISVRFSDIPVFWVPSIKIDLKHLGDSPIAVKMSWGGFQGSHLSLRYQFMSYNDFKAFLRLDGYLKHGLGGGIETEYAPDNDVVEFYTRNYFAHDISIEDPAKRDRYRFEGTYYNLIWDDAISVQLLYDKVSDPEMASDYQARDFDLLTAGRTQLDLRMEQENWIAELFTKVRINPFQTVNQQLPSFFTNYRPFEIGNTGIIAENTFQIGYYNYVFGNDVITLHGIQNFHSARFKAHPIFYRPFFWGPVTATPKVGFIGIAYSNSQNGEAVGQAIGEFGFNVNSSLYQIFGGYKHVVEPYVDYTYLTAPTTAIDHYFIFDITDAYARLNQLRFGTRQSLFAWEDCTIVRRAFLDLYANAFFDTSTIPTVVQKLYMDIEMMPIATWLLALDTAWNFEEGVLDYYNVRTEWTLSENLAFALEYRHRSRYDWRKADLLNFILESARSEESLEHSSLSDRRDTFLARIFYRFHPDWSIKFQIRHGWDRMDQPSYTEYQADLGTVLRNHLRLHFIYDKRQDDHRFSVSFRLDKGPRSLKKYLRAPY